MFLNKNALSLLALTTLTFNVFALPDDQYQPIEIQADSAIRQEKEGLTTYQGNVFMSQGSLKVEADNITVSRTGNDSATNLTATGKPAKFEQQPEADKEIVHASANLIYYQLEEGKIELTGEAKLNQGEAQITSDKIVYLAEEQIFKAEKSTDILNTKPQRVQVIIPAKKKLPEKVTP
jgi:lipopolysaccharide export system protein LptA